jgi:glycosyltransferase involved in cell wall biosynthesis
VARALRGVGFDVAFLVVGPKRQGRTPDVYDGMTVRHLQVRDRLPFMGGWKSLRSALEELQPRFLYTRGRSWLTGAAAAYAHANGAVSIWATNGEDSCEQWKFTRRAFRTGHSPQRIVMRGAAGIIEDIMYARGIRRADVILNQTATQRESLRREFDRDGIVIHSIQDLPDGPFIKRLPPVVLWIGQLVADKRPGLFLDLVERCSDLDVEFRLIGKMSPSSGIEERLKGLRGHPRFSYLGSLSRDDVHAQLTEASLIVNTSTRSGDGVPNAMIEAWMRQTPALTMEIDPDGLIASQGGGIVCGDDIERMALSLRELLLDPALLQEMGEKAGEIARNEFSAERNGRRYRETLERFVEQRATARRRG